MNSPVSNKDVVCFFSIQVTSLSSLMLISVFLRHWESRRKNWELPARISRNTQNCFTTVASEVLHHVCKARLSNFCLVMIKTKLGCRPATCHHWGWEKEKNGNVGYHILACQLELAQQCCKGNGVHTLLWHMFNMDHCAGCWGCK